MDDACGTVIGLCNVPVPDCMLVKRDPTGTNSAPWIAGEPKGAATQPLPPLGDHATAGPVGPGGPTGLWDPPP